MANFFQIDFQQLVQILLPVRLRNSVMSGWLDSLVAPVGQLYTQFSNNRTDNLYQASHNSQVVYMQEALNDTFDPSSRGIYITDGSVYDPLFVYLSLENQPLWLGLASEAGSTHYPDPQWLYTGAETMYNQYSFIVYVPVAVFFDPYRMQAIIDRYRLPSKYNYLILTY